MRVMAMLRTPVRGEVEAEDRPSTFGWFRDAVSRASAMNPVLPSRSFWNSARMTFTAMMRSRLRSRTSQTSLVAPSPSSDSAVKRSCSCRFSRRTTGSVPGRCGAPRASALAATTGAPLSMAMVLPRGFVAGSEAGAITIEYHANANRRKRCAPLIRHRVGDRVACAVPHPGLTRTSRRWARRGQLAERQLTHLARQREEAKPCGSGATAWLHGPAARFSDAGRRQPAADCCFVRCPQLATCTR